MIHSFSCLGVDIVLDVASGAVMRVDPLARAVIECYETYSPDEIRMQLSPHYSLADIGETLEEVALLRESGALFSDDDYSEAAKTVVNAEPVIKAMCLHAAHDCNLRCRYCFASGGEYHGPKGLLSEETGRAALTYLFERSGNRPILEVDFFGGEPLLNWPVVKRLVAFGRSLERPGKRFKFTITTNGVGLTEEHIDFFEREIENVVISVDGRAAIHDHMRPAVNGRGSYGLIMPMALELAKKRAATNQSYYVRGTFTRHNLDFTRDVKALHEAGFTEISLEPVVASTERDYALREDDMPIIAEEYERLAEYVLQQERAGNGFRFFHFMLDLSQGPCVQKRLTGCGAGAEYIAVTPEGDVYPCHQFVGVEYTMGNVNDGTFDGNIQALFKGNHVLSKPDCVQCWAKYYCSGGCAANGYQYGGGIGGQYKLGCDMERKRLECALALHVLRL